MKRLAAATAVGLLVAGFTATAGAALKVGLGLLGVSAPESM